MSYENLGGPDTSSAGVAQLGAVIGPLVPYLVWLSRRDEEPFSARQAAVATNFGAFAVLAFLGATAVRLFAPLVGFIGTIAQWAIVVAALVLCLQAYNSVRKGVPATYPVGITLIRS